MSKYIIPKGWNSFDVMPSEVKYILCMTSSGIIDTVADRASLCQAYVCWKYPQPLEKDHLYIAVDSERCDITVSSEAITGVLLKSEFLNALNSAAGHNDEKIGVVMRCIAGVLSEEYNEVMP